MEFTDKDLYPVIEPFTARELQEMQSGLEGMKRFIERQELIMQHVKATAGMMVLPDDSHISLTY